jgi:hypothetical protein
VRARVGARVRARVGARAVVIFLCVKEELKEKSLLACYI